MKKRHQELKINLPKPLIIKIILFATLLFINGYIVTQLPPSGAAVSLLFASSIAAMIGLMASFFITRSLYILCSIYIFILLVLNYLVGPNILNTILLTSFIIGLAILLN